LSPVSFTEKVVVPKILFENDDGTKHVSTMESMSFTFPKFSQTILAVGKNDSGYVFKKIVNGQDIWVPLKDEKLRKFKERFTIINYDEESFWADSPYFSFE
jgi:hypothetical protein